jgi:glycosyltransferase involved in cell wall biosynthesis
MHIALVSRWYPPHTGYGGIAAYTYYLAHALVKLGHRVTVMAARWSPDVQALEMEAGMTTHRLLSQHRYWPQRLPMIGRYMRPIRQLRYSIQVARKLRELEAFDRPDVVEFAEVEAEGFAYLRARRRCRVIVRCHTPTFVLRRYYNREEAPFDMSLTAAMEKSCIRRADTLTAPSIHMSRTIAGECDVRSDRVAVVPNALDVALFADQCQPAHAPAKVLCSHRSRPAAEVVILHVGRLERVKGIDTLVQAIPLVLQQNPSARFVFIGDDRPDGAGSTWRQRLEAYARASGIAEQVCFLGSVSQSDLIDWYHKADIAVVPSMLYESFSYTCAQAMAAGLPVVASQVGGIPETLGDCGLLVPAGDLDALAEALGRLACEPGLRRDLGRRAHQRAREQFDASVVARQMVAVYQQTLAR